MKDYESLKNDKKEERKQKSGYIEMHNILMNYIQRHNEELLTGCYLQTFFFTIIISK